MTYVALKWYRSLIIRITSESSSSSSMYSRWMVALWFSQSDFDVAHGTRGTAVVASKSTDPGTSPGIIYIRSVMIVLGQDVTSLE